MKKKRQQQPVATVSDEEKKRGNVPQYYPGDVFHGTEGLTDRQRGQTFLDEMLQGSLQRSRDRSLGEEMSALRLELQAALKDRKLSHRHDAKVAIDKNAVGPQRRISYEVRYVKRHVVLYKNDGDKSKRVGELAHPQLNTENDLFMNYLDAHADEWIPISLLAKKALGEGKFKKPTDQILQNLGFVGSVRKAFIDSDKNKIKFQKLVQQSTLDALGVNFLHVRFRK